MNSISSAVQVVRILLVDDHTIMREGVRGVIASVPRWRVIGEAGDSESGWEAVGQLRPDLILLDLDIPGEGGLGLLQRVSAAFAGIKVIMLSSNTAGSAVRAAAGMGASGYVSKVGGGAQLIAAIHTVIAGGTSFVGGGIETQTGPVSVGKPVAEITPRERQVLMLFVEGLRNKEIADRLGLSIKSVETYRARMMKKTACTSPAELVRYALRSGIGRL